MKESKRCIIFGLGAVGKELLTLMSTSEKSYDILAVGRNPIQTQCLVDNIIYTRDLSVQGNAQTSISAKIADLSNIDQVSEVIQSFKPDFIINMATAFPWRKLRDLNKEKYIAVTKASLGAWLAPIMTVTYKISKAIEQANYNGYFINGVTPDLVNPAIATTGFTNIMGCGNIGFIPTALEQIVAKQFSLDRSKLNITVIAHHFFFQAPREVDFQPGCPFFVKVVYDGVDITEKLGDTRSFLEKAILTYPNNVNISLPTAASAQGIMDALCSETPKRIHIPGPMGLEGGYPMKVSKDGLSFDFQDHITEAEAKKINRKSSQYESIENFGADGYVEFTQHTQTIMQEELDFHCKGFNVVDCEQVAAEQIAKFNEALNK